ncbi:hypothetical protein [Halocynthiibacter namhaensis]|uniref:hypothetical protein n=1 Tax=Halocynthiibacter namhaensis TaxID=1290553 RepID=UPI0005798AE1|nr:hypothetical protein [Halocynthiibacter namhaensis]
MLHRTTIIGGVFGLVAPFIGLFVGLQVSTVLATLLLLPFVVFSALTHTPIGNIDAWVWAFFSVAERPALGFCGTQRLLVPPISAKSLTNT